MQSISLPEFSIDFPYAYGQPEATASFRVEPEDFQVDENLNDTKIDVLDIGCGDGNILNYLKNNRKLNINKMVLPSFLYLPCLLVIDPNEPDPAVTSKVSKSVHRSLTS